LNVAPQLGPHWYDRGAALAAHMAHTSKRTTAATVARNLKG
jgi:hypothetical protein